MKNKAITLFMCILFTSLLSCQSNENETPPLDKDIYVRAQIDGSNWEAETFTVSYINNIVSLESSVTGNASIELSIQNVTGTGAYSLGNVSIGVYEVGLDNLTEAYTTAGTLGSGTVNITKLTSSRIEGTFSFTGGNGLGTSKSISSGSFKINLIN